MIKNAAALLILLVLMIKGVLPSIAFLFFVYFSIALYARFRIRALQKESQEDHIHNLGHIEEFIGKCFINILLNKDYILTYFRWLDQIRQAGQKGHYHHRGGRTRVTWLQVVSFILVITCI